MAEPGNKVLARMLDRLYAGLLNGPNMNCRPYASRQRLDFALLARRAERSGGELLRELLGTAGAVSVTLPPDTPRQRPPGGLRRQPQPAEPATPAVVPTDVTLPDKPPFAIDSGATGGLSAGAGDDVPLAENSAALPDATGGSSASAGGAAPPDSFAAQEPIPAEPTAAEESSSLVHKLRILIDDARTYEQDTGAHVLYLGFPLLSVPPGKAGASGKRTAARRVLAPIAFLPLTLTLRQGTKPTVELASKGDGVDLVVPNAALLAWIEQQTGIKPAELFDDAQGDDPWREIASLVRHVAKALKMDPPAALVDPAPPSADSWELDSTPRANDLQAEPAIVPAAVLGLFPMNNAGLLRDMQAMVAGESLAGPVESFIKASVSLEQPAEEVSYEHDAWSGEKRRRVFAEERLVTVSDPCQSRAVRLARTCRGLVIHGPPGTGKSQTITNIIGDHLARGERVLMVCDKRTALDVVANRLAHLGLGGLCAVIHDPERDQRDLYRAVREQVETLAETKTKGNPDRQLKKLDGELESIHAELTKSWELLQQADPELGVSFHELVGQWLNMQADDANQLDPKLLSELRWEEFERHERAIEEALARANKARYATNPWNAAAGMSLAELLAQPAAEVRRVLERCVEAARSADETNSPDLAAFGPAPPRAEQAAGWARLAERWQGLLQRADLATLVRWSSRDLPALRRARDQLQGVEAAWNTFLAGPLDVELAPLVRAQPPTLAAIAEQSDRLARWQCAAATWHAFLHFQLKHQAAAVLRPLGLPTDLASATRGQRFLQAVRARLILGSLLAELSGEPPASSLPADDQLERSHTTLVEQLDLLLELHGDSRLATVRSAVLAAFADKAAATRMCDSLRGAPARATAIDALAESLRTSRLFQDAWIAETLRSCDRGESAAGQLNALADQLDSLEGVLRVRQAVEGLPQSLRPAVQALLDRSPDPRAAADALHKGALSAEISARIRTSPELQLLDDERQQRLFERYNALDLQKKDHVRDAILHYWIGRQQERLLVATGSRLNSLGADLRRRLTMRGERALRLRQVIAVGQGIEGGDPLFDVCPVWLASPETVGQVFPRLAMFDVVIFDEASQCKLEEALPVLTRAKRVVIAGDPKQLPPSRFFESAVAASEQDEIATDQQLFEQHQGEIEDLLSAALGLDIQQCYLDVHYRSRTADLIEFSNEQFYSSRLQPIPGHPSHRLRFAPITLYHAGGVYEDRANEAEAEGVCLIVRDLLRRAEPPSIGIACFNLQQRDLIAEKLDELAEQDREFAARLAVARTRQGAGSFEGLFVKNLENVQGDERDHIIISTTYGPDAKGKFYKRFGPLGRAGGGRRLNVLVTRARAEVHLVTSIPPAVYRHLPPVPPGQVPGGGWLLFSYLAYAEHLAEIYAAAHADAAEPQAARPALAKVWPSKSPSRFAQALATELAERHDVGSEVHWGNDGFCVDLALAHPDKSDDVTIGLLCDASRFPQAEDPVEWDVFRTAILTATGWRLRRVWTPRFFRDPAGNIRAILAEALPDSPLPGTP